MIFIDSSVFLEVQLKQQQAEKCLEFIEKIVAGEEAFTTDYILYAVVLTILNKRGDIEVVKNFLNLVYSLESLTIYRPSLDDISNALELMAKHKLDFDDSLCVASMQSLGTKKIATLDKDFKKLNLEFVL